MHHEAPGRVEFVHRSWPADPRQLVVIRRQLASWLEPLSLTDNETADVVLAVDEAAANAVRHAYGPDESGVVELTLWTEPGTLCIEIVDHGSWRTPGRPAAEADRTGAPGADSDPDGDADDADDGGDPGDAGAAAPPSGPGRSGHGIPLMRHASEAVLIRYGGGRGSRVLLRHRIPDQQR